ncbi:DUF397 domain-containing protein [Streptomyces halstedii]|uniref:DUF397 domain-containing protein n=1 Tax=Streptomyces halstedii TaxID=1944 RepID=UPI0036950F14
MVASSGLEGVIWRKARASESANGCLEVAFLGDGRVAIRDNEDLDNPPFVVTAHVWRCFMDGAQKGEFDAAG